MFDAGSHEGDGLGADAYRQRFGLMQKVKLGGPVWLAMLRETKSEHIRNTDSPLREPVKTITTAERRAEQANSEWPVEHGRNTTPPEPMRAPLKAKYGTETGHPDEFIRQVAVSFVEEPQNGQRGVYKRLGERMRTDWSTARSSRAPPESVALCAGYLSDRFPRGVDDLDLITVEFRSWDLLFARFVDTYGNHPQ